LPPLRNLCYRFWFRPGSRVKRNLLINVIEVFYQDAPADFMLQKTTSIGKPPIADNRCQSHDISETAPILFQMGHSRTTELRDGEAANLSLWTEALFAAELLLLYAAPVYYGMGIPEGDGSGVVLIPGLLAPDFYLKPMHSWLSRIGYEPYFAGIACNAQSQSANRRLLERRD